MDAAPLDLAPNGHAYYENYIADIDPADPFLEIAFTAAGDGTFTIAPVSTNRSYKLLYYTDLMSDPAESAIDDPSSTLTLPTNATGFGRIRVTLPSP